MRSDRRRTPRVQATLPVYVRPNGLDIDFTVVDLSFGGFRARGPRPLAMGETFVFRFSGGDRSVGTPLAAKVVFCRSIHVGTIALFDMGLEFLKGDRAATTERVAVLNRLMTAFQFELIARSGKVG